VDMIVKLHETMASRSAICIWHYAGWTKYFKNAKIKIDFRILTQLNNHEK